MNKKRIQALSFAVVFALSVVVPVRQANALVPLVGLAVSALGPGGTLVSADLLVSGVSALIGGSIVALAVTPSTAEAPMRVPLASDQPTIDAAMPPPPAAATSAPTQTQGVSCRVGSFTRTGSDYDQACSAAFSANNAYANEQAGGGECPRVGYSTCETYAGYSAGQITVSWTMYCVSTNCANGVEYGGVFSSGSSTSAVYTTATGVVNSCGAGYVMSGDSCVLQNARVAQPDNKYDVPVVSGSGGFSAPSASQESDLQPSYASFSGGKVYAQGKNSSGQPVVIEYSKNSDGSKTYITHYTQSETSGQTEIKTQSITVDSATGSVVSAGVGTSVGSLSPATGANSVPTVSTGAAVTSGSGTQQQTLVLPTDYARAGESASAASSINTKLDTLHRDLTEKGADVADPVSPDAAAFSSAFFSGTFADLLSWRLPAHTSECPTVTFDYMMFSSHQVHHMDAQCAIAEQIRPVLSVVMVVVWTIVALFVLLEA